MGEQHAQSYVHDGIQLYRLNELQWQNSFLCLLFIYLFSISRRRKLIILSNDINQQNVGGKQALDNTTRGGGRQCKESKWWKIQQEGEEQTMQDKRVVNNAS